MIKYLQELDTRTFLSFFYSQHQSSVAKGAMIVSSTANGWLYVLLIPLCILIKPTEAREILTLAIFAFVLERALYYLLKNSFKRRRPPAAIDGFKSMIVAADEFSLPSGHTSAAFLFVTILCSELGPYFLPLYPWAIAVGMSRVILGVHFFTDVFMGAILGTCIALYLF